MSDLDRPHEPAPSARARAGRGDAVADRLERIPSGRFHRNFLLMVTAGEFVESFMLLGNGVLLALVAQVLHFRQR